MNYLYRGEFEDYEPERATYKKTFRVDSEDIFLSFQKSEIRTKDILVYYDIKYFNLPVPIKDIRFKTLLNFQSLKEAVLKNFNKTDYSISLYNLNVNRVVIKFDVSSFLLRATYPSVKVSKKTGDGIYTFKLTKKIPSVISQSCGGQLDELFSKVMLRILITDKRYSNVFRGSFSNDFIFKRKYPFRYFDINFNEDKSEFEISIKNSLLYMLFYDPSRKK